MDITRNQCKDGGRRGRDEGGFVLVLALVMLAILSILASVLMNTSTTELKIVNNYQSGKQSFYAVERAVEYATNRNMLVTMGSGLAVDMITGRMYDPDNPGVTISTTSPTNLHKTRVDAGSTVEDGGGVITEGVIEDLLAGDLPAKLAGGWGSEFGANQYRVRATAVGPGNSRTRVEAVIVRIYKSEDESVFRTSGGG